MCNQAYAIEHPGPAGEGKGVSIVVADSESAAVELLSQYFAGKDGGDKQNDQFTVKPREDHREFRNYEVAIDAPGVVLEFVEEEPHRFKLIYLGMGAEKLADELDVLQSQANEGRGISHIRSVINCLRRGYIHMARVIVSNEADKTRAYPEIIALLKRVGFWFQINWLKERRKKS